MSTFAFVVAFCIAICSTAWTSFECATWIVLAAIYLKLPSRKD